MHFFLLRHLRRATLIPVRIRLYADCAAPHLRAHNARGTRITRTTTRLQHAWRCVHAARIRARARITTCACCAARLPRLLPYSATLARSAARAVLPLRIPTAMYTWKARAALRGGLPHTTPHTHNFTHHTMDYSSHYHTWTHLPPVLIAFISIILTSHYY